MALHVDDQVLVKGIVRSINPLVVWVDASQTVSRTGSIAAQGANPPVQSHTTPGTFAGVATDVSTFDDPSVTDGPHEPIIIILD